ncbi:hypothetical protein LSH36_75g09017 [Paralvinella palmiformis]|uniref:[histone H3]-dimethyl-L-lysine(9) demethylase n=1 Tax=Paralvinella palmiformis TaxID=53620 RepID=A0AAD9K2I5_9ANNE|nr:hypothetical protein LSH36_75g09017 [Paralvinella palmiformis]
MTLFSAHPPLDGVAPPAIMAFFYVARPAAGGVSSGTVVRKDCSPVRSEAVPKTSTTTTTTTTTAAATTTTTAAAASETQVTTTRCTPSKPDARSLQTSSINRAANSRRSPQKANSVPVDSETNNSKVRPTRQRSGHPTTRSHDQAKSITVNPEKQYLKVEGDTREKKNSCSSASGAPNNCATSANRALCGSLSTKPVVELVNIAPQIDRSLITSNCCLSSTPRRLSRSRSFCGSVKERDVSVIRRSITPQPVVRCKKLDEISISKLRSLATVTVTQESSNSGHQETNSSGPVPELEQTRNEDCTGDKATSGTDNSAQCDDAPNGTSVTTEDDSDSSTISATTDEQSETCPSSVAVSRPETAITDQQVPTTEQLQCSPVTSISSSDRCDTAGEQTDNKELLEHVADSARNSGHCLHSKRSLLASKRSSSKEDSSAMALHYKKMMLVDKKDKTGTDGNTGSSMPPSGSIDVNHSILDQIARLNKGGDGGKRKWDEQDAAASLAALASSNGSLSQSGRRPPMSEEPSFVKRTGETGRSHVGEQNNNMYSRTSTDSGGSSSSSGGSNNTNSKDQENHFNRPGSSRPEERGHSATPPVVSASSASGQEQGRSSFEPYRDPELLKRDTENQRRREMQQQQQPPPHSQRPTHTPIPPASSSYPAVHTPIPSPLPTGINPATLPAAAAASALAPQSHPLINPLGYSAMAPHLQISAAHLQMAPASSPVHALVQQQQQVAAATAAHLQQLQLLQQQQQQSQILSSFSLQHNSPHTRQLELLWQQKFPNMPVPPAWMLHQYQDEILRDVHLLQRDILERERRDREILEKERTEREQRERAERERIEREQRDRAERERLERERLERERAERERQERERQERERREKLERERAERERAELEKAERERKEKERLHQEQQLRLEREHILMESSAVADAVNQHFQESFMRLTQKAGTSQPANHMMMTPAPYPHHLVIMPPQHPALLQQQAELHEKTAMTATSTSSQDVKPKISPHDTKSKQSGYLPGIDAKTMYPSVFSSQPNRTSMSQSAVAAAAAAGPKSELNFNLYGYQPQPQMYISPDKLVAGLKEDKVKVEPKTEIRGAESKKANMALPPPLIRDKSSSVIVENKPKDLMTAAPPAHHHGSITLGTAIHKPQIQADVKQSVASVTSVPSSTMAAASILASLPMHDVRLASSQQNLSGLNLTVSHSSQIKTEPSESGKCGTVSTPMMAGSRQISQVGQCPVSLPVNMSTSMAYNYGLLQQGLAANPLYSQTGNKGGHVDPQSGVPSGNRSVTSPGSNKRRSPKEMPPVGPRKKAKLEDRGALTSPVGSDLTSQTGRSAPVVTAASDITATQLALAKSVTATYMDSFRSFVMNAVQHAFMNDEELNGQKNKQTQCSAASKASVVVGSDGSTSGTPSTVVTSAPLTSTTSPSSPSSLPLSSPSSLPLSTLASAVSCTATTQISGVQRPGPASTPGAASVSSTSSMTDMINRVANNMDTDSDTLSAPSPPGVTKWDQVGPSPLKSSGSHTKGFKKAWLARYSDQDKDKPFPPSSDNSNPPPSLAESIKSENSMDSVTASSSSMIKEELCPSPVNRVKELVVKEEPGNSSASEAESHESGSGKKRSKSDKKRQTAAEKKSKEDRDGSLAKKQKVSTEVAYSPASSTSSSSGKKKKKTKNKSEDESVPTPVPTPQKPESPPPPAVEPMKPQATKKLSKTKVEKPEPKPMLSDSEMKMEKKLLEKDSDRKSHKDGSLSSLLANKPLNKEPVAKLKKSLEPFLQDGSCTDVTPKLTKCRECKMPPNQRNKKIANANIFCRFYAFRRLRFSPRAYLTNAGFSEPSDADADDIELWYPCTPVSEPKMSVDIAKYVVAHVGDRFCELVEQERIARSGVSPDTKIAWKRAVQGVREMCDVCDTTLFNMHWVCHKCGFVVCIDCYKLRSRKSSSCTDKNCKSCEKDGHKWLTCSVSRQAHEPDKLMLTQIIPSDVLWVLGRMIHEIRERYNIQANCPCGRNRFDQLLIPKNGISQSVYNSMGQNVKDEKKSSKDKSLVNGISDGDTGSDVKGDSKLENGPNFDPLNMLAVAAIYKQDTEKNMISDKLKSSSHNGDVEDKEGGSQCSTLRDLLTQTGGTMRGSNSSKKSEITQSTLEDIIQKVVEKNHPQKCDGNSVVPKLIQFKHYRPRNGKQMQGRDSPIPMYTLSETSPLYPDIPHEWLDHGKLLRLLDPKCKHNIKLFQQQWRRAQPVVVSNCDRHLSKDLWLPASFARDFGDLKNDLVNCTTNSIIIGHKMRVFWDGFEKISARLKDNKHQPMNLKLKDWPPTEDFAEILPKRFADLMQSLPLPEYTNRSGVFNLASRLPEFFVKPDLGPKMYNAYGSSRQPGVGTTNLHLDVSDAVNLMLYVGIPSDDKENQEAVAAMEEMSRAGACDLTKQRVKEADEKPGALWHIYDPQDADKIRDLLNKVGKERGEEIEAHHDPIHDQSWYLDEELREHLLKEYGVQGYTIVQCFGDAVFIPAGAPHQVRNLHSCIKAAEDFVSPENMNYCFRMTQEFRHLSDTHTNHEDKLQIKNIIYHAVKDAVALLREHDS